MKSQPGTPPVPCADSYDIAVIGAGPAGMAVLVAAAGYGLKLILLDENAAPGGQIYRAVGQTQELADDILGAEYQAGRRQVAAFQAKLDAQTTYVPQACVWSLAAPADEQTTELEICFSQAGMARLIRARHVIVATGAQERPFPIPGWTLPGVMSAGAAQIALKASRMVPAGRIVLAGSGPLLYLLASQLLAAGVKPAALLDTMPATNWLRAASFLPDFMRSPYFGKGLDLLRRVRSGMPVLRGINMLRADGTTSLSQVGFSRGRRLPQVIEADHLLLHQGVVPSTSLAMSAGCTHHWSQAQCCWQPDCDRWGMSSVPAISIAGDGAGILGAAAAGARGTIAALGALYSLGAISAERRDNLARFARAALDRARRGRSFLDALYRPADGFRVPADNGTMVCRCEEVTAGQIRAACAIGAQGPNQLKSFTRCGMGPCQGRMCGLTVTEIMAAEHRTAPSRIGSLTIRAPIKPVTLAELAGISSIDGEAAKDRHVR